MINTKSVIKRINEIRREGSFALVLIIPVDKTLVGILNMSEEEITKIVQEAAENRLVEVLRESY